MNALEPFGARETERRLTDWMQRSAPGTVPTRVIEAAISTTRRARRRPRWLALLRTPTMTTESRALVGAPVARLAYLSLLVLVALALAAGGIAIGARLMVSAVEPASRNGLIAVDAGGDILVAEPDGSEPRRLTTGPDNDSNPTWSRDGRRLAFWSTPEGSTLARLVIVDADGGSRSELLPAEGWLFQTFIIGSSNISWSPDDARIATIVSGVTGTTIALIDAATGAFTTLDIEAFNASFLAWSPDGEWLAYVGRTIGGEAFVIRPDGADERSVSPVSMDGASYLSIDWSPDSRALTYSRVPDGGSAHGLYAVDITSNAESLVAAPASGVEYWWPTFSPDGASLASGGSDAEGGAIFVMGSDGDGLRKVATPVPVTTEDVTWSPDGDALLAYTGDIQALLIIPIDDPAAAVRIETGGSTGAPSWQRLPEDQGDQGT
jgi:dipeptidyl aminopeptidase/acylaminoacyl peptidase